MNIVQFTIKNNDNSVKIEPDISRDILFDDDFIFGVINNVRIINDKIKNNKEKNLNNENKGNNNGDEFPYIVFLLIKSFMEKENLLPDIEFQKKSKIRLIILLPILVILLALTICFIVLYILEKNKNSEKEESNNSDTTSDIPEDDQSYHGYTPLSSWNNCTAKTKLSEFISKINSAEYYVPKEDRIAVFDLDGTLYQETDPTYDDWKLYYYRVYNDTNFTSTEEQKQIADAIKQASIDNHMPDDLNWRVASTYTQLFYNMTIEEYQQYIINFINQPCEGYENMKRGDAFYKPMLELIEYIQKNDFNVYITSGTDRYQV